ncbi:DUF4377 domain-containing protein [Acinetobacter sp. TY2]|uniref:DUF4377 domain-containing protein n=1 Tax=Acinetobacter sp. TY2 TaxID=3387403 RepID=UPI003917853F
MKLKYLAIALFPLALAACQSNGIQKTGDSTVSVVEQQNVNKTLTAYQWSANTANAPKPLVLNFDAQGRLAISTSCNNLMGGWKVENNQIVSGNLAATQMACEANAMAQEGVAANLFSNRKAPFTLDMSNPDQPKLTIVTTNGEKVEFTGTMTPETKYQSEGETIFLEISPETKQCTGVAPQTCLQVKEIKYAENGVKTYQDKDWTLFYNHIEGFEHDPKAHKIIRVKRYEIKNPAADQSKYAYVFDMTVMNATVK